MSYAKIKHKNQCSTRRSLLPFIGQQSTSSLRDITSQISKNIEVSTPIVREPQVIILNQHQLNLQENEKIIQSGNIKRASSCNQKFVNISKRQIQQETIRKNSNNFKKVSPLTMIRQKSSHTSSLPKKIYCETNTEMKSSLVQKILDFRTKVFKITKKTQVALPSHRLGQTVKDNEQITQKMNNLRNIAIMNIQQNLSEINQFKHLNALLHKSEDLTASSRMKIIKQGDVNDSFIEDVKQYSNNNIYQQIRKIYQKEKDNTLDQLKAKQQKINLIKGITLNNYLFNSKDRNISPNKIFFKKPIKNQLKNINQDRLSGW